MQSPRQWIERLRKIPPEKFLLFGLLLGTLVLWSSAWYLWPRPLVVTVFAVGKGDALLIQAPSGRTLLVDGGSSDIHRVGEEVLVPNLLLAHVKRLDAILLTHSDSDHLNGLPTVLENVPVGMLLDPEIPSETPSYQQLRDAAESHGVPCRRLRVGDRLNLGDGVALAILAPPRSLPSDAAEDTNNNSVVCMLEYRQARMLLTGDLEAPGETDLLARKGTALRADVLKVAHHGSRTSTTNRWLDAVKPAYAIISCPEGADNGAHPHTEVLSRLRQHHSAIYRTDINGQIRLRTDGRSWQISTYRHLAQR